MVERIQGSEADQEEDSMMDAIFSMIAICLIGLLVAAIATNPTLYLIEKIGDVIVWIVRRLQRQSSKEWPHMSSPIPNSTDRECNCCIYIPSPIKHCIHSFYAYSKAIKERVSNIKVFTHLKHGDKKPLENNTFDSFDQPVNDDSHKEESNISSNYQVTKNDQNHD